MIVWVLIITMVSGGGMKSPVSVVVIDNIASAESCEQLARIVRRSPSPAHGAVAATCAPVRKVKS